MKRRAQVILPALYLAFATYGWIDFVNTNHDGLANLGLFAHRDGGRKDKDVQGVDRRFGGDAMATSATMHSTMSPR